MKSRHGIFQNERVSASAGAGKTYALTNRFIALCRVCSPEEICALTFTRAAAAEFLDKILTKLAYASVSDSFAKRLSGDLERIASLGVLRRSDFADILARVVKALPRLTLSTIDSFQFRFASAFATELGIVGKMRIMDDFEYSRARSETLKKVFAAAAADGTSFESFAEAVSEASGDTRSRRIFDDVSSYLDGAYDLWCSEANLSRWGNPSLFRSPSFPYKRWDSDEYARLVEKFSSSIPTGSKSPQEKFLKPVLTFFSKSRLGAVYQSSSISVRCLAEKASDGTLELAAEGKISAADFSSALESSMAGAGAKSVYNPELSCEQISLIREMLSILIGGSILCSYDIAKAVGKICDFYDISYRSDVRMRGRMTFQDVPIILASPTARFTRSLVEYRLDAKYKHWLIDEFQDTSRLQWETLSNLVDEIMQDSSGDRTVYYVGDVKQSIYSWRGGDPRLFDEVFEKYGNIREGAQLDSSWRSVKPVIDAVNALFGSAHLSNFDADAYALWKKNWRRHISIPSKGDVGCAMIVERDAESDEDASGAVWNIINAISPQERGLSVAVLVRKNSQVREIVDSLRARILSEGKNISVSGELDAGIAGVDMVVPAALALLRAVEHPSNTAAYEYVRMTPLSFYTETENWRFNALAEIFGGGMEKFFSGIFSRILGGGVATDGFSRLAISRFLDAAADFDSRGGRDADMFCYFIKKRVVRESSKQSTVRVMTIHKSKGLDFDVVIMPRNESSRGGAGGGVRLRRAEAVDGGEAIFNMPSKSVCAFDSGLTRELRKSESALALEGICNFYVGVTRAKRAVYFVVSKDAANSGGAYNFEKHIVASLPSSAVNFGGAPCRLAFGRSDWYLNLELRQSAARVAPQILLLENPQKISRIGRFAAPSYLDSEKESKKTDLSLPRFGDLSGTDFGSVVHSIFRRIKHLGGESPENAALTASAGLNVPASALKSAVDSVAQCLHSGAFSKFFADDANVEVRTEYPFSIFANGFVQTGVFDRLNIRRSEAGDVESVLVIDYKTGLENEDAHEYEGQMESYFNAAKALFPSAGVEVWIADVNARTTKRFK